MTTNNNQTKGEKTMTTKRIDDIKRLLAKFEQEYGFPLSMPSPSVYETAIVRLNEEILAQAQRDGVVSRELQCERDQTEARYQMAMTFAPFVNALPALLDDLEAAQKREQALRHELTRLRDVVSAVEHDSIDAALAATEVKP
jgi:adenosine deaminase